MKNNNDEIRKANKKALPKFLLILACSLALGFVLGFCMGFFDDSVGSAAERLSAVGRGFSLYVAPWLLGALVAVLPAASLPLYFSSKKQASVWDGEDEAVSRRVERRLSVAIWIVSLCLIVSYVPMAAVYSDYKEFIDRFDWLFLVVCGCFLAVLAEGILIQQRIVDLIKRMNPEKRGSVYDMKFQKKWLDSCDEAEKAMVGKCAYKAFAAVSNTCAALAVVFTLSAISFGTGFLPVLVVGIVWGVSQSVYILEGLKLDAGAGSPL